MLSKKDSSAFFWSNKKGVPSVVKLGGQNRIISSLEGWAREFDCTFFILKIVDNRIYNHNFPFRGWLLLLSKHRYFKETSLPEFSWHRANVWTAVHCLLFCSSSSFYNLYKLSWGTDVTNFDVLWSLVTIFKRLLCDKWQKAGPPGRISQGFLAHWNTFIRWFLRTHWFHESEI